MSKFGDGEVEEDSLDESLSEKSDGDEDEDEEDDEGEEEDEGRPDDVKDIINDEEEIGGDEEESHRGHHHRKRRKGTAYKLDTIKLSQNSKGGKFLKKLWCRVGGSITKIIWFYQLSW